MSDCLDQQFRDDGTFYRVTKKMRRLSILPDMVHNDADVGNSASNPSSASIPAVTTTSNLSSLFLTNSGRKNNIEEKHDEEKDKELKQKEREKEKEKEKERDKVTYFFVILKYFLFFLALRFVRRKNFLFFVDLT